MNETVSLATQMGATRTHLRVADCAETLNERAASRRQASIHLSGVPRRLDEAMLSEELSETGPGEQPDIAILTEANAGALLTLRFSKGVAAIFPSLTRHVGALARQIIADPI